MTSTHQTLHAKSVVIGRAFRSLGGQKSVAAGAPPRTPLGELRALRDPVAGERDVTGGNGGED